MALKKIAAILFLIIFHFSHFPTAIYSQSYTLTGPVINIPIYNVQGGGIGVKNPNDLTDNLLDGNNWSIVWGGKVSDGNNNYFDLRIVGNSVDTKDSAGKVMRPAGIRFRVQLFDAYPQSSDKFEIVLNNSKTYTTLYQPGGDDMSANGLVENRCTNGDCRGWTIDRLISWSELGGKPSDGTVWPLKTTFYDTDLGKTSTSSWNGYIRWGLPRYEGTASSGDQKINVKVTADATVGGNTECGRVDGPDYFPTWGSRNYEKLITFPDGSTKDYSDVAVAQNQWDIADWPCYSKEVVQWVKPTLPNNAVITKATLTYYHFGEPGYANTDCYADNRSKDTVFQIFELTTPFVEDQVTWDNLPSPRENISRLLVQPSEAGCNANGTRDPIKNPYPRVFDITEIIKRGLSENRNTMGFIMYTSAGQYHSGKYFWTSKGGDPGAIDIYYNTGSSSPTSSSSPTTGPIGPCPLRGDTSNPTCNNKVDVLDYSYLSSKFGSSDQGADLDGSNVVNVLDYSILSNNFGKML